jgi:glycerol uptake facilitator-like aquaporin
VNRPLVVRCAAEALGTSLLVGIGTGAIVAGAETGGAPGWALALAWFAAVTLPVLLFARVSGAHLNPMVTVALLLGREFPKRDAAGYVAAQVAGAFGGSFGVLAVFGDEARLGSTVPVPGELSLAFAAEAAFTFLLVLSVFLLTRRGFGRGGWRLTLPGTVVALATYLIGPLTGSSLNVARTLAPAVLSGTFQDVWLYFVAVPFGALVAVPVARVCVR